MLFHSNTFGPLIHMLMYFRISFEFAEIFGCAKITVVSWTSRKKVRSFFNGLFNFPEKVLYNFQPFFMIQTQIVLLFMIHTQLVSWFMIQTQLVPLSMIQNPFDPMVHDSKPIGPIVHDSNPIGPIM